jgi:PPOX class probable FMN-dependent enzyme
MKMIKDTETLREILGQPRPLTRFKIQKKLNARAQDFIRHSPLMMLSTSSRGGESTVSPKGDQPGFVFVRDELTLYVPERQGNKLIFSLQNILDNPNVGLLFIVPGMSETLRVQGVAELTADEELCRSLTSRGKAALLVMIVRVTECYFHCAKAFLRGSVWQPESWSQPIKISFGEEISCNSSLTEEAIRELDTGIANRYVTDL